MPVPPTETFTVRAEEVADAAVAVTVTEVGLAPSPTLDGAADRVTGQVSSSVRVTAVPAVKKFLLLPLLTDSEIVSLLSTTLSSMGSRVKVPVPVVVLGWIKIEMALATLP